MFRTGVAARPFQDSFSPPAVIADGGADLSLVVQQETPIANGVGPSGHGARRHTPRKSLIVVLPENHVVSPDQIAGRLPPEGDNEQVDVILAFAGQPTGIAALERRVRDLQVVHAPAGTSTEDLRELAMSRAPGDIVTLLLGTPASALDS